MKLWSLPILAAFAFASAPAFAQSAPAKSKPPASSAKSSAKGVVNIVCNPSCDDVVIGNRSFGPSPVVRAQLPAGAYDVTLKRKSQADTRKRLVVTAGQAASFNFALTTQAPPPKTPPADMAARIAARRRAMDGWLNVQCDPGCDDVVVDGKRSLGRKHTNVPLPPGDHVITGKRKGAPDMTIKVRVLDGQTTAVRLTMGAPSPAQVDIAATRAAIEKKLAAGTATQDDVRLLRSICHQQNDKACVARMDARLRPAPSRSR